MATSLAPPVSLPAFSALATLGVLLSLAAPARADLDGQQACLERELGSSCTRSSGAIGTCQAEPSAPGVSTCVTEGGGGGSNGGGTGGTTTGSSGYTGTGTGAQAGSVDGPACSTASGASDPVQGLLVTALCGAAMVLARSNARRSERPSARR